MTEPNSEEHLSEVGTIANMANTKERKVKLPLRQGDNLLAEPKEKKFGLPGIMKKNQS